MVSVWWIVFALLVGVYSGAILVSLLTINTRDDDRVQEREPDEDVRLVA